MQIRIIRVARVEQSETHSGDCLTDLIHLVVKKPMKTLYHNRIILAAFEQIVNDSEAYFFANPARAETSATHDDILCICENKLIIKTVYEAQCFSMKIINKF